MGAVDKVESPGSDQTCRAMANPGFRCAHVLPLAFSAAIGPFPHGAAPFRLALSTAGAPWPNPRAIGTRPFHGRMRVAPAS